MSFAVNCNLRCEQIRASTYASKEPTDDAVDAAKRILARLKDKEADYRHMSALLHANTFVVNEATGMVPIVGSLMKELTDFTKRLAAKEESAALLKFARAEMAAIQDKIGSKKWKEIIRLNDPERTSQLSKFADTLLGDAFDDIDDKQARDRLQNEVIRLIATKHDELEKVVLQKTKSLRSFGKELASIKGKRDAFNKYAEQVYTAENRISDESSAASQQNFTDQQRRDYSKRLYELSVETTNVVKSYATEYEALFVNLGNQEAARYARFVRRASDLTNAFLATSQNPLSAVSMVNAGFALFGDADHEQQNQLDKQQQLIIQMVAKMYLEMMRNHHEVMQSLEAIGKNVLISMAALSELLLGDLRTCGNLIPPSTITSAGVPDVTKGLSFSDYTDFAKHFETYAKSSVTQCLAELNKTFSLPFVGSEDEVSRRFLVLPSDGDSDAAKGQLGSVIELFAQTYQLNKRVFRDEALVAYSYPSSSIDGLMEKISALAANIQEVKPSSLFIKYLPHLISPRKLEVAVLFLLGSHLYYDLAPGGAFRSEASLKDERTKWSLEGRERLKVAKELLEVAIAQQTMLAGDILLPLVGNRNSNISGCDVLGTCDKVLINPWNRRPGEDKYSAYVLPMSILQDGFLEMTKKWQVPKAWQLPGHESREKDLEQLINQQDQLQLLNQLLTHNVLVMAIRDGYYRHSTPIERYRIDYNSPPVDSRLRCTEWPRKRGEDGYVLLIALGDVYWVGTITGEIKKLGAPSPGWYSRTSPCYGDEKKFRWRLPTPDDVERAQLSVTPDVVVLDKLREKVIRELMAYVEFDGTSNAKSIAQDIEKSRKMGLRLFH